MNLKKMAMIFLIISYEYHLSPGMIFLKTNMKREYISRQNLCRKE